MRTSGIVLPIFSLPSHEGIGTLGEFAYNFIDFLFESKQQYWQVPPISHPKENGSPYSSFCVFSGNYNLIDIKKLVDQKLLDEKSYKKYAKIFKYDNNRINYKKINEYKLDILETSFEQSFSKVKDKVEIFIKDNSYWIQDYALFVCLKKYVFENKPWQEWDNSIKNRKKVSLNIYVNQLKKHIDFVMYTQYLFYSQWFELKRYANSKNIKILGEFPLYCDLDSSDVWSKTNLFMLNKDFLPFEKPHHDNKRIYEKYNFKNKVTYNIDNLKKSHYRFLLQNIKFLNNIYDSIIIDNFDNYNKYKCVELTSAQRTSTEKNQTNNKTDKNHHQNSNNENFLIKEKSGIKNDLFSILKDISLSFRPYLYDINFFDKLLDTYGLPVVKTMTDGFSKNQVDECLPHNFKTTDIVYISDYVYQPLKKFKSQLPGIEKMHCRKYINNYSNKSFNYDFIAKAYQSAAEKILIPMQDILGTKDVLLNKNNKNQWCWRISKKDLNVNISRKLRNFFSLYNR